MTPWRETPPHTLDPHDRTVVLTLLKLRKEQRTLGNSEHCKEGLRPHLQKGTTMKSSHQKLKCVVSLGTVEFCLVPSIVLCAGG